MKTVRVCFDLPIGSLAAFREFIATLDEVETDQVCDEKQVVSPRDESGMDAAPSHDEMIAKLVELASQGVHTDVLKQCILDAGASRVKDLDTQGLKKLAERVAAIELPK